jgi:hypothetical protein
VLWSGTTLLAVAGVVILANPDNVPVLLPLLTCLVVAGLSFLLLWKRRGDTGAFCEVGALYVAVVTLYTALPLIGYLAIGMQYAPTNDGRLYVLQPSPIQVGRIGWYCTVHLIAFAATYFLVRGRLPRRPPRFEPPDRTTLIVLVAFYVGVQVFFAVLSRIYGLTPQTYGETYLVAAQLPLLLRQLANHMGGARLTIEIAILAALFGDYYRYRLLILAWLAFRMISTVAALGSRTELVLALISSAMLYHYLVRPIPFGRLVAAGGAVLGSFVLLGLLRGGIFQGGLPSSLNLFSYASEFEVIFGNGVHLDSLRRAGDLPALPLSFYFSDFLALIPQQFAPFTKIVPSIWYVTTYFPSYAAVGGGVAFGTIAESIVGWGWLDLIARGAAMGVVLGVLHRGTVLHRRGFWIFVLYVWASVQIYHSFRNTTFTLFPLFVFRFVSVALASTVAAELVRCAVRGSASERDSRWADGRDLDLTTVAVNSVDRSR